MNTREGDAISAREELYELAELLLSADNREKKAKKEKEGIRGPFFDLISEIIREEIPLARQTVEVRITEDFDIDQWRARNYPEWRICGIDQDSSDSMIITLEENEAFKKFEFVHQGIRYGRSIRMKGAGFDTEGFSQKIDVLQGKAEWNDERAEEAVTALASCVKKVVVTTYELDEAKAMEVMAEYPETVALFQEYTLPGTPEPALLPIKAAKEENE